MSRESKTNAKRVNMRKNKTKIAIAHTHIDSKAYIALERPQVTTQVRTRKSTRDTTHFGNFGNMR